MILEFCMKANHALDLLILDSAGLHLYPHLFLEGSNRKSGAFPQKFPWISR